MKRVIALTLSVFIAAQIVMFLALTERMDHELDYTRLTLQAEIRDVQVQLKLLENALFEGS